MVRVNLIEPSKLADQHLIAEYREILLLFGMYRKRNGYKIQISDDNLKHPYRFFHNKLKYLEKRHLQLRQEMINRNFNPQLFVNLDGYPTDRLNDFVPNNTHIRRVEERIIQRLKEKPDWYRYHSEYKNPEFFMELMNK